MIISAPRLFRDGVMTGPGAVAVEAGLIAAVLDHVPPAAADHAALDRGILSPGLIDIHNNGAFGIDCATGSTADFITLCSNLAKSGITAFLPTIITAPVEHLHEAASRIHAARDAMAELPVCQIIGLHLEGPFLTPAKRGAHREEWLKIPDEETLDRLLTNESLRAVLRLITLAPELPGALEAIRRFVAIGVAVSLGHTNADAETTEHAAAAGARLATHVFNAMRPFAPRDPGIVGTALTDRRLSACFIVDGVHVDPAALRMGLAASGARAIAVTDSIALAGLDEGSELHFGGESARLEGGAGRRSDGTLAGAAITLDEGIRRLIRFGIAPETALASATEAPARALGLAGRGRIAPGMRADLVWWDDRFEPLQTWIGGAEVHQTRVPEVPLSATLSLTATIAPLPAALPLTETIRPGLDDLDAWSETDIIMALFAQEKNAARALANTAPALARLAAAITAKLDAGGRLFYAGAGTSGRLAVLDAVECGPTFSLPPGVIIPLIAGGDAAIAGTVEGAEDDTGTPRAALATYAIGKGDALVGIAASGRTPFVLAAVKAARAAGALTGAIVNSPGGPIVKVCDVAVEILGGAEILAGSTRLSAGTTQKMALNALSTTIMIRLGKTYGPLMVDVRATNTKLRDRALRIVARAAACNPESAAAALQAACGEVKTAILMLKRDVSADTARARLAAAKGHLRAAILAG